MSMTGSSADKAARLTTFATLGALGTTQELVRVVIGAMPDADADLVAEETLTMIGLATARAAEVGLKDEAEVAASVVPALSDLPFLYRDYLIGGSVIMEMDETLLDEAEEIYQSLQRKRDFYAAHFPKGKFPGELALKDKMGLWMGRISPPSQPDMPDERLERLSLIPIVLTHLKLVLAFGRRSSESQ